MERNYSRRSFLRTSVRGAMATGLVSFPLVNSGCNGSKPFDLIITGGIVYDGLGNPGQELDVAISGDRIVAIGRNLNKRRTDRILDAMGMAVTPGFIDIHTHTNMELLANPMAESHIRQGITTEVTGNCGSTPFPIAEERREEFQKMISENYGLDLTWSEMTGYFQRLEEKGMTLNLATYLGHGSLRGYVVGLDDRPATESELEEMKAILDYHMNAGVWGLSTGLEYTPGSFAPTGELIELCRVVEAHGGIHATHMRDEEDGILESIEEALRIARETGVNTEIAHFKAQNPANWHKLDRGLEMLEQADQEGLRIMADRYPYIASATGLSIYFPLWAREGTTEDFMARLKDPDLDQRLRTFAAEQGKKLGGWDNIRVTAVNREENKRFEGVNIVEGARQTGKDTYDFMRDLLIDEDGRVGMVSFSMSEENLRKVLAHPLVTIGSDGNAVAPYGILHKGKPHPRYYGTFPRFLGKYVREEQLLTLPEAIRKITSLPAGKMGFEGRGQITEGYYADLVILDPVRVIDRATFEDPHQYPEGIYYVIVNGQVVIRDGETTGNLPGRILRKF